MLAVPVPFVINQTPPLVASVKAGVLALIHTEAAPLPMAATVGKAFIANGVLALLLQSPEPTVYTTVTVPAVRPVTTPPWVMLAVPVPLVIDQTPPCVASVNAG